MQKAEHWFLAGHWCHYPTDKATYVTLRQQTISLKSDMYIF